MLSCNSALVAIASEFVGTFAPYQSIQLHPDKEGGVWIASTDKGNCACIAYDRAGHGDRPYYLLPNSELIKSCRGIKTATRTLVVDGSLGKITTYRKNSSETKELPVNESTSDFPNLPGAIKECLEYWESKKDQTASAGRYSSSYLQRAIKGLTSLNSSVTLHSYTGGPLRIQEASGDITILCMPQTAEPIPEVPEWLKKYSQLKPHI